MVPVGAALTGNRPVAHALETHSVAVPRSRRFDLGQIAFTAGIEGWVDVDQVNTTGIHPLEDGQIIPEIDTVGHLLILTDGMKSG